MQVDYYEECELDEHSFSILKAMRDLEGRVASKNQLYEFIKKNYGGMPKKTFFKRLQMLEKCGFIKCHSTSHKKLGIECEVTDLFILKKAFEEIERILTLPPLTEDPLSDTLASITVTQLIFCDIIHGIILGSILETALPH